MERPEIVRVEEVLSAKHGHVPPLITVNARDKVRQAIDVLHEYNISQAPVVREAGVDVAQFVGGVHENALLDRIFRDPDALQADVAEVMGPPIGLVEFDAPIELAFQTLQHGPAVLVEKAGEVLGSGRSDLLGSWRTAPASDVRALGIDVGVRKGLDLVLLDGDRAVLDTARHVNVDDLHKLVPDFGTDVVAIDAPPAWASSGRSRLTERELRWFGVQCSTRRRIRRWQTTPSTNG
jgi:predicted transcriptional regulator